MTNKFLHNKILVFLSLFYSIDFYAIILYSFVHSYFMTYFMRQL